MTCAPFVSPWVFCHADVSLLAKSLLAGRKRSLMQLLLTNQIMCFHGHLSLGGIPQRR